MVMQEPSHTETALVGERFTGSRLNTPIWILFAFVLALSPSLVVLFSYLDDPLWPSNQLLAENTTYVFSESTRPPTEGWKSIAVYNPADAHPELFSIWQEFEVDLSKLQSDEQLALFIPYIWSNVVVMIGDELVAQTAPMTQPMYMNRVPLIFPMARSQLERTGGVFHIRAVRDLPLHEAYSTYVGPLSELQRSYDSHMFNRVYGAILSIIVIVLVGSAVSILFFLSPPGSSYYGWFALTSLLYGSHSAWYLIGATPLPIELWSTLGRLTLVMGLTLMFFYHRYFGVKWRVVEWVCSVVVLGAAAFQVYAGVFDFSKFVLAQLILTYSATAVSIYAAGFLLYALWRWRNVEALLLALTAMAGTWVFLRDCIFLVVANVVPGHQFYSQYFSTVSALVFGLLLIRRFANSLQESQQLNAELEQRVEQKVAELGESYEQLTEEQAKRLLADERTRIMRDMHDGLGGQLVHAISLSTRDNNQDLQSVLRFALDDLRLIIDSLSPTENNLGAIIAAYRHRTTPMVHQQGIDLYWHLEAMDPAITLQPKSALGVLRVIQEAVTNSVKHAQCNRLDISLNTTTVDIIVNVKDNGIGLKNARDTGRGTNNMKIRAVEMGGDVSIDDTHQGTSLTLKVPLGRNVAAQPYRTE